jgi:hypothetical protein
MSWPKKQVIDLTGKQYGRWTVLGRGPDSHKNRQWFCRCECGNERLIQASALTCGDSKSCGCLRRELTKKRSNHTHETPEYNIWTCIIARCYNPRNPAFPNYGGRSIMMSDEWRFSFPAFLNDMGARPSPGLTIERIDNSKGYSKENCYWGTRTEQANNTRRNVIAILPDGSEMTVARAIRKLGLNPSTTRTRIDRGQFHLLPFVIKD